MDSWKREREKEIHLNFHTKNVSQKHIYIFYQQRPTFGVNIYCQNLCLFWDTELFRCALKTIRNFRCPTSFDHLSEQIEGNKKFMNVMLSPAHILCLHVCIQSSHNISIYVHTCNSSILRSLQSCNSDDGSESVGAAVLWLLMLLDVPGNFTATYAPSTLSTWDKIQM